MLGPDPKFVLPLKTLITLHPFPEGGLNVNVVLPPFGTYTGPTGVTLPPAHGVTVTGYLVMQVPKFSHTMPSKGS